MNRKIKKFKKGFLQDLSQVTDSSKDAIRDSLGINTTNVNNQPKLSWLKKHRRQIVWTSGFAFACLVAIITIVSIVNYNNIPVYQGMFASKIENSQNLSGKMLSGEIEQELIDQFGVSKMDDVLCFEKPNTDILITISIENPKSFEMLSITLNGVKYTSYQFEDGSTTTKIKVKYPTSSKSGIEEITIDEIKYIDGTKIKIARYDGERTIKIGVTYQNTPSVEKRSDVLDSNAYNLCLNVIDIDKLIDINNGLYIYLIEEDKVVTSQKLELGVNDITFDNLKFSTTYSYLVLGAYDLLDGEGLAVHTLYSDSFTITDGYYFEEEIIASRSVSIKLLKNNKFSGKILRSELYLNDVLIKGLNNINDKISFDELQSNTEYVVTLTYEFNTSTGESVTKTISYKFKTDEVQKPTIEFDEIKKAKESISFSYKTVNNDNVKIKIDSIELLYENQVCQTLKDLSILEFNNLYSNSEYVIKINYSYDLFDGNGWNKDMVTADVHTISKENPIVINTQPPLSINGKIEFPLRVVDVDKTLVSLKVELYCGDDIVQIVDIDLDDEKDIYEIKFSGLTSNKYQLVFVYEYNLNDATGNILVDRNHSKGENKITVSVK